MLGGDTCEVKAYAGGIDLDFTLDELVAQAEGFLAQGFQAIKMKVGRDVLEQDIDRVQAVRKFVGSDFPLMVDANMRWTVDQAIGAATALRSCGLYWLEEPVIPDDFVGHARVQSMGGVPVASGENLHSTYEFSKLIEGGGVTYPEPDAATVGGITPWLKVAELSQAHGLQVTSHGIHDIHVHLLAAVPNADYLEVHGFGLERFIEEPLQMNNGLALAPDRPGHGVVLDFGGLETYRHTI
jgi:L-alanine-DL-glutamate epimerase-like enolase superfamily enzyme